MLNKLVQVIAEHTGHSFSEVKTYAKEQAVRRGYPYHVTDDGVVPYSETEISVEQAGFIIEELYQIAAEVGALYRE